MSTVDWKDGLSRDEIIKIETILSSHKMVKNRMKVIELLNRVKIEIPNLDIYSTNTRNGDIRIGIKPLGKSRAIACYITISFSVTGCFIDFAHSYIANVLRGNYQRNEVENFIDKEKLNGFSIVPGTLTLKVSVQDINLDIFVKLLKKINP